MGALWVYWDYVGQYPACLEQVDIGMNFIPRSLGQVVDLGPSLSVLSVRRPVLVIISLSGTFNNHHLPAWSQSSIPMDAQGLLPVSALRKNAALISARMSSPNDPFKIGVSYERRSPVMTFRSSSNLMSVCVCCFSIRSRDELACQQLCTRWNLDLLLSTLQKKGQL